MVATVTYALETVKANFQANTFTGYDQFAPDVLGLSNGGYVVAYNNFDVSQGFIFLDFYDANGASLGIQAPFSGSTSAAGAPTLAQMTNGNVVVVWDDNATGDDFLQAAIYTEDGVVVRPEFDLPSNDTSTLPQVAALEGGGFAVVSPWVTDSIFLQIYDENGDFVTGDFDISTPATGASEPVVAGLADDGMVVAWTVENGANHDIVAVIFEEDGTQRLVDGSLDPFVVGTIGDNTQPSITALPNGNWAVAYTDSGWSNEDIGITLTIMGPDGEVVNAFEHVNAPGDPQDESDPDITVLDNGFIVVSWTYPASPGTDDDIHCRIFDQDGNPITVDGSSLIVLENSSANELKSAISGILAGQFVAGWQDADGDTDGTQISAAVRELVRTTTGDGASETLNGDELRDIINGKGGDDTLTGGDGDDTLNGGADDDTLNGSAGLDTASYAGAAAAVTVSLDVGGAQNTGGAGIDTLSSIERLTGSSFGDTLTGNSGDNVLSGGNGVDTLTGANGNDRLDGGIGADIMAAGNGNDTYVVDSGGDQVTEAPGFGSDTVESSITYTLGANVDNLTLTGSAGTNATGNGLSNTITGNSGVNRIDGGALGDTMAGGNGNDTYVVDSAGDTVTEAAGAGIDTVESSVTFTLAANVDKLTLTGSAGINGTGNSLVNTITGNSGVNRIDGGIGADKMAGGNGNDIYVVDSGSDVITEAAGFGIDSVESSVTCTLAANVEKLTLTGSAGTNGTGNASVNTIIGNTGANRIDGGIGADKMAGGNGNDVYVVDSGGDVVTEASGAGTGVDSVESSVTHTLAANVEKLTLTGSAGTNGTGNALANTIIGNSGANRIDGDAQNDTLTGGGGNDDFVFDDGDGADTVTDFQNGADQFDLSAVAGVNNIGDLTIIDNGATVTVNYGTGSFTIANLADPGQLDAGDFLF